ncbi:MAG: endonuclease/exonuclease/phosphatase family protein [Chitinophagales bacterium]|nr:endonuclease/exonuclease/phosphatase family protein [Chitinophagales bacterium]MDW8428674.1 endonuclease/exonuclease/phosphatase family protein [Chitinophagales bacterium]
MVRKAFRAPGFRSWIAIVALLLAGETAASGQSFPKKGRVVCLGFYNVENLFDTIDNPLTQDEEFTPAGEARWTAQRMSQKSRNIARVIAALNEGKGPDVLGLSEVENDFVLRYLLQQDELKKSGLSYIHFDSPDMRGIDVCLLYRPKVFRPIAQRLLRVDVQKWDNRPTRDILWVKGLMFNRDTLHVFVNHWPSRRGGRELTEPKRLAAAKVLHRVVDSLLGQNPDALIVVMGDFNDNPGDASLSLLEQGLQNGGLINCMNRFDWKRGEGTEYYQGLWYRFIQILVSPGLKRYSYEGSGANACSGIHIFRPNWIMKQDASGHWIPKRSIDEDGSIGFSDHLPVYLLLRW